MSSVLLQLNGVCRSYDGGRIEAVREATLHVNRGDWLTITGPSGSGKSTLLNLICGLDMPSKGEIMFDGRKPGSAAEWTAIRSRSIGFIFQAFNLLPTLTALENVQIPMFGLVSQATERRKKALALLERVELSHRAGQLPCNLSGGERQRVAIARSLANSPSLILADEPTGNLDSKSAEQIINLLKRIHSQYQTTVVMITHNPLVAQNGNRWIKMVDGIIETETSYGGAIN